MGDYSTLRQVVDVVLHLAAATCFDERYDTAVRVNALGSREVRCAAGAVHDVLNCRWLAWCLVCTVGFI